MFSVKNACILLVISVLLASIAGCIGLPSADGDTNTDLISSSSSSTASSAASSVQPPRDYPLDTPLSDLYFGDLTDCINKTGKQTIAELTYLNCAKSNNFLSNIKGLEYLTELRVIESLGGNGINIYRVDLSQLTKLTQANLRDGGLSNFDPSNYPDLIKIDISGTREQSVFDFSNNPHLTDITISEDTFTVYNPENITHLTFRNRTSTEPLNLSQFTNLEHLGIESALISTLDISQLKHLKSLQLSQTPNLETIIWPETNLLTQYAVELTPNLTQLNLANLPDLLDLKITHDKSDNIIDLSVQHKLQSLSLINGDFSDIDFTYFRDLKTLTLDDTKVSSIDLRGLQYLQSLSVDSPDIKTINVTDVLTLENLTIYSRTQEIAYLLGDNSNITHLEIQNYYSQMFDYDFSMLHKLKRFSTLSLGARSLDLSGSMELEDIDIFFSGNLKSISLPKTDTLKNLHLGYTSLSAIDISSLTGLEEFHIFGVVYEDSTLVLPASDQLKVVTIENFGMSSIDTRAALNLETIYISETNLAKIDFSQNTAIKSIGLSSNKLIDIKFPLDVKLDVFSVYDSHLSCEKVRELESINADKISVTNTMDC
jgi:hypothetical protein